MKRKEKKMKARKRILAIVATVAMIMTMIPAMAFATGHNDVAVVNGTEYTDVCKAVSENYVAGETLTVEVYGSVAASGSFAPDDSVVKFVGMTDDATIALGSANHTARGCDFTFKDLTLTMDTKNYRGFQHSTKMTYDNCTIVGTYWAYEVDCIFNGCTFKQAGETDAYNIWTYGSKNVVFTDCTFESAGKTVLIYNEGTVETSDVNFDGCKFIAGEFYKEMGKAAVEIDSSLVAGYDVTIKNSAVDCVIEKGLAFDKKPTGNLKLDTAEGNDELHFGTIEGAIDATCTEDGYTGDIYCDSCDEVLKGEVIEATGHNFVNGVCTVCSAKQPVTDSGVVAPAKKPADSPQTGDTSNMTVPFALAGLAMVAMAAAVVTRRKQSQK